MLFEPIIIFGVFLGWASRVRCDPPFHNPPGVDVWCGKAYRETNSSFDPGGWLDPPSPNGGYNPLRLSLNVYPRYNFYVDGEETGSFIVDTLVSDHDPYGGTYDNSTTDPSISNSTTVPFTELVLTVRNLNATLVDHKRIPVNASGIEIPFSLDAVKSLGNASFFEVIGSSPDELQNYESLVRVEVLPERADGGSMARLDRLNRGIHVRSSLTGGQWKALFPVGFYTRWDWISWLVDPKNNPQPDDLASNNTGSLAAYKARGYNLIHPVPPGGWESFDTGTFEKFLTICDELELYVMYDMRHTYLNLSSISGQLPRLQAHPSLLLYYTGDEPDGSTDPLDGTRLAYNHIRSIDPYHPVSLVLNCFNFHFKEYTSGADIILEDTYPLIKSSTFSPVYNTVCNQTYGDCGCDLCHAGDPAYPDYVAHPFKDVVERTRRMYAYQSWLGNRYAKPVWGVPQWFYDADSFWARWATREEAVVMAALRIQYGAMGIAGWIFPTSPEVEAATTDLAGVLSREDVTSLLVSTPAIRVLEGEGGLHVSVWSDEREGVALAIIVYDQPVERGSTAFRLIPWRITGVEYLYGGKWNISEYLFQKENMAPLEVSVLKIKFDGYCGRENGTVEAQAWD